MAAPGVVSHQLGVVDVLYVHLYLPLYLYLFLRFYFYFYSMLAPGVIPRRLMVVKVAMDLKCTKAQTQTQTQDTYKHV